MPAAIVDSAGNRFHRCAVGADNPDSHIVKQSRVRIDGPQRHFRPRQIAREVGKSQWRRGCKHHFAGLNRDDHVRKLIRRKCGRREVSGDLRDT